MKMTYGKVLIFLAAILVGILLTSNLEYIENLNIQDVNSKEYLDQVIEKNTLINEITKLEKDTKNARRKLNKYTLGDSTEKIQNELTKEIEKNRLESGYETLEGEGVEIILDDAENIENNGTYFAGNNIHDYDVLNMVNELRNFGAEAISINGIRVNYDSEIYCYGSEILINEIAITVPFRIKAIGDKDKLWASIVAPESYYGVMVALRPELKLSVEKSDEIIIQGNYVDREFKYMQSSK